MVVNIFPDSAEGTAQVWEQVSCGWVQQDVGTGYASAAITSYAHVIAASVPLKIRLLRNPRCQAPVSVCLLSCKTICLMQTKQIGGQCWHLLGMTFPTCLHRRPQLHRRSRKDPSGDPHVCRLYSLDAGWQILENKGKVRIHLFQLLV